MFRRISVLSLLVLFALAVIPVSAQQATPAAPSGNTIVVTNLNPNGPGSLRDAVDKVPSGGTITFASSLKGTILFGGDLSSGQAFTIIGPSLKSTDLTLSGSRISLHAPAALTLENLTIANSAGILVFGGTANINNVTFQNNAFAMSGGAIASAGTVHISNSLFQGNTIMSDFGAAIDNSGDMTIANSTFQGNVGTSAIYNIGHITITNSTFSGNSIGPNNLILPTLKGDSITLKGTIIDGVPGGPLCDGKIIDGGGNLQFPTNECGTSIPVGDPKLGLLQDNGGPTWTMMPQPGSAAIGKLSGFQCPTNDQRGFALPALPTSATATCDIGAYQTGAGAVATPVATTSPAQ